MSMEACHGYQLFANNVSVAGNNHHSTRSPLFFYIGNQSRKKSGKQKQKFILLFNIEILSIVIWMADSESLLIC